MDVKPPIKAAPAPEKKWKLAKGRAIMIPGVGTVTNEDLQNPTVVLAIQMHEGRTGHKIFNNVIVAV